jgi:hypothetical protein
MRWGEGSGVVVERGEREGRREGEREGGGGKCTEDDIEQC